VKKMDWKCLMRTSAGIETDPIDGVF
jgi:hypothetical protein